MTDRREGLSRIDCDELGGGQTLAELLDIYAKAYPQANRAAVASQWSMDFLCIFLSAVFTPLLANGLAANLKNGIYGLFEGGKWVSLETAGEPFRLLPHQLPGYLDGLLQEHIDPLFQALSAHSGLAEKVLWTNLMVIWDSVVQRVPCGGLGHRQAAMVWMDHALMPATPKHLRKLLWQTPSPVPELMSTWQLRVHCCLHFQLCALGDATALCETCPKLRQGSLASQIRYLRQLRGESRDPLSDQSYPEVAITPLMQA